MALPDDWSFQLAQAFLDAAVSCGATCERRFISPSLGVEGPPPGCPCQLVVTVQEGWAAPRDPKAAKCSKVRTATVKLILDVCVPAAGQNEVPDPVKWTAAARDAATLRWQIMRGLDRAWHAGQLCGNQGDGWPPGSQVGCCSNITPDSWRPTRQEWGSSRWETTWTWRETA